MSNTGKIYNWTIGGPGTSHNHKSYVDFISLHIAHTLYGLCPYVLCCVSEKYVLYIHCTTELMLAMFFFLHVLFLKSEDTLNT